VQICTAENHKRQNQGVCILINTRQALKTTPITKGRSQREKELEKTFPVRKQTSKGKKKSGNQQAPVLCHILE
jgi:hypothetical protein